MSDQQFKVLITRLNLIIDLLAVVVQDDGHAMEGLRAGVASVEARGA